MADNGKKLTRKQIVENQLLNKRRSIRFLCRRDNRWKNIICQIEGDLLEIKSLKKKAKQLNKRQLFDALKSLKFHLKVIYDAADNVRHALSRSAHSIDKQITAKTSVECDSSTDTEAD